MKKNKLIWAALVAIVVLGGIYFFWARSVKTKNATPSLGSKSNGQQTNESQVQNSSSDLSVPENFNESGASNESIQNTSQDSPEEKRSNETPDEALRQQIIAYVNQNLNSLIAPPKNDKWDVPTFYFVGNSKVYVELYAVDTDLAGFKLLYDAKTDKGTIKLTEIARFKEGEEDWILSQGKDDFSDYVIEEYDFNEKNKKWEKTDEFSEDSSSGDEVVPEENSNNVSNKGEIVR